MKRNEKIIVFLMIIGVIYFSQYMNVKEPVPWIEHKLIAHALGDIEGMTYTNSLEALSESIEEGYQLVEADILLTNDNQLVLRHDWGIGSFEKFKQEYIDNGTGTYIPSLDEFKNSLIDEKYTAMTFEDLLRFMKKHKDFYVITDTKYLNPEEYMPQFEMILSSINAFDPSLLDRFIVQFYNLDMYYNLSSAFPFKEYIFTIYAVDITNEEIVNFMAHNQLKYLTMYEGRINQEFVDELTTHGIFTLTHTINDLTKVNEYMQIGIDGFYTDTVLMEDIGLK
jgi:glycerophosphoryl diester phosphodiesterase